MHRCRALIAVAVALLSLAAQGCSCAPSACTGVVNIAIAPGIQAFSDGTYIINAKSDGTSVEAKCTLADARAVCDNSSVALGRGAAGLLVVGLMGTPKHVDLTVWFGSNVLATTSFDPQYTKQSSGDSCGGDCLSATHATATK